MRRTALKTILLLGTTLLVTTSAAQQRDFPFYNDSTYALYQRAEWGALSRLGHEAIRAGYDSYFLRMRVGIADYERGQYRRAAHQFYRALTFNRADAPARAYLYYSLLWGGRPTEARLAGGPADSLAFFRIEGVFAEGGFKQSDNRTPVGDLHYGFAGLQHTLGRPLTLTYSFQYLEQQFPGQGGNASGGQGPGPGGPNNGPDSTRYRIYQRDLFGTANWQLRRGWALNAGFRLMQSSTPSARLREPLIVATLTKDLVPLRIWLSAGWARIDGTEHLQYNGGLIWYPGYNSNLYLLAEGAIKQEDDRQEHWMGGKAGIRLADGIWLEGQYYNGYMRHFYEQSGAWVYNFPDWMDARYGGGLQWWLPAGHVIYAYWLNEEKQYSLDGSSFRHRSLIMGVNFKL